MALKMVIHYTFLISQDKKFISFVTQKILPQHVFRYRKLLTRFIVNMNTILFNLTKRKKKLNHERLKGFAHKNLYLNLEHKDSVYFTYEGSNSKIGESTKQSKNAEDW